MQPCAVPSWCRHRVPRQHLRLIFIERSALRSFRPPLNLVPSGLLFTLCRLLAPLFFAPFVLSNFIQASVDSRFVLVVEQQNVRDRINRCATISTRNGALLFTNEAAMMLALFPWCLVVFL